MPFTPEKTKLAAVSLQHNSIRMAQKSLVGSTSYVEKAKYYSVDKVQQIDSSMYSQLHNSTGVIIFQVSPETIVTTIRTEGAMGILENIGSVTAVVFFLAQFFVISLERRML